jgi:hypothetical protein
MSELSVQSTQAHTDPAKGRRNTAPYVAIIAAAVVALACIGVSTAVMFVLIDEVPWHHLWEHLLSNAPTLLTIA